MSIDPNRSRGGVYALQGFLPLTRALGADAGELGQSAGSGDSAITTFAASIDDALDELLEKLQRRRQRAVSAAPGAHRAARVAELYEQEARLWSLLFERSERRLQWRAALAAEAYARSCARAWRTQAHAYHDHAAICRSTELDGAWS